LARDGQDILPPDARPLSTARKVWGRGLPAATALYPLAFLWFVGRTRYQSSAHLLQPGVDPRREQQALLALNEGAALTDKSDLDGAEHSFQRALRLWVMTVTSVVAAVVPSLVHSCWMLCPLSAAKYKMQPIPVRKAGFEQALPALMSLTSAVLAAVQITPRLARFGRIAEWYVLLASVRRKKPIVCFGHPPRSW
jgi:hypothetical protein